MFSDVLLTVDFDRTLTDPNANIPQRNLDAIAYFMENGGTFTVNTGRTVPNFRKYLTTIPVNAPFLMYNGGAAYENGKLTQAETLDMDPWQTWLMLQEKFPDVSVEIHGMDAHYLHNPSQQTIDLYENAGWEYQIVKPGDDLGPFIKIAIFDEVENPQVSTLYQQVPERMERFAEITRQLEEMMGDKVEIFRPAARILNINAKGVSKIRAARDLQKRLGKKILVCVGDAENDIPMLDGADYAFCPCDSVVADRYPNVCDCAEGAVADVIYKKIPQILGISP